MDEIQPPEPPPMTQTQYVDQAGNPGPQGSEGVAIVGIVLSQMESMKSDILRRIDTNATSAMRRWQTHEDEHHELAKSVKALRGEFDEHMKIEREKDIVFNARLGPVRSIWKFLTQDKRWAIVFGYIALQFVDDIWAVIHPYLPT